MRPERLELWLVELPLSQTFGTATTTLTHRQSIVLRLFTDAGVGWGECAAFEQPFYTSEFNAGVLGVIEAFCWPALRASEGLVAADVTAALAGVKGHPMAKAALEMAALDAELRASGESLAGRLGASRRTVEVGVAVGLHDRPEALVEAVAPLVDAGYRRVKLKIEPGNDAVAVAAVRAAFGADLALQVDANGSYDPADLGPLRVLDGFDLLLIEQPFDETDLAAHVRLADAITTPICLDESITSLASARQVLEMGACSIVNLKPGRVGGYLEATRIHDLAVSRSAGLWCGGMFEMGLARAANLALAALPGFTLPGDLSATDRYYETDITPAFELVDGSIEVPRGPGIGVEPDVDALARFGRVVADLR